MAKKKLTLGMAAAAAAGTAVYVAKKTQDKKNQNGTSQNDIRDKANSGWSLTQHKYFCIPGNPGRQEIFREDHI